MDVDGNDRSEQHVWEPPHSAASRLCGAMVMRDGGGDQCGLPPEHPVHEAELVLPDGCVGGHRPDLVACEIGADWP